MTGIEMLKEMEKRLESNLKDIKSLRISNQELV